MSQAGFCAGSSAPFVQRGLQRRSQRGKPDVVRVGDNQGAWEEEGVISYAPGCKCPPTLPGMGQTLPVRLLGIKRDEKFCMAGCGERQRQSRPVCA